MKRADIKLPAASTKTPAMEVRKNICNVHILGFPDNNRWKGEA